MYMIVEVSQYVAVASFSEAWIEILLKGAAKNAVNVASFSEAWIEIKDGGANARKQKGRLLLGGVD